MDRPAIIFAAIVLHADSAVGYGEVIRVAFARTTNERQSKWGGLAIQRRRGPRHAGKIPVGRGLG